jgi:signal peptidase II
VSTDKEASRSDSRKLLQAAAIAITVVVLDQTLKRLTPTLLDRGAAWPDQDWPLRLVHVVNTGAAFGKLQGQTRLLVVAGAIGIVLFVYMLSKPRQRRATRMGLALALGGAIANFIDRATSGEVIDSIKVEFWPAFNLADVALTCGIALVLWSTIRTDAAHAGSSASPKGQESR